MIIRETDEYVCTFTREQYTTIFHNNKKASLFIIMRTLTSHKNTYKFLVVARVFLAVFSRSLSVLNTEYTMECERRNFDRTWYREKKY